MGVVLKEQAPEVLLKAIQKVHAGEVWLDRTMLASVLGELTANRATPVDAEAAHIAMLTGREYEVIAQVRQGLKNKQIANHLGITETTVRHHLSSIFDKLGVASRLELVIFAHQRGLTI
jgi:DNA-binding NarL/FixJ family response regulator